MRKSNYGVYELAQNIFYVVKSKILFPGSRMIRFPVIVRGKKYIDFGSNLTAGRNCRIEVNGRHSGKRLMFGNGVNLGDYTSIRCADRITIGNNVLMGSRVLIIDNTHGKYRGKNQSSPAEAPNERRLSTGQITIGDNVWIGEGAVIQKNVEIGEGTIICANAVVTKSIPARCIAGGVPANVLKKWNEEVQQWENI